MRKLEFAASTLARDQLKTYLKQVIETDHDLSLVQLMIAKVGYELRQSRPVRSVQAILSSANDGGSRILCDCLDVADVLLVSQTTPRCATRVGQSVNLEPLSEEQQFETINHRGTKRRASTNASDEEKPTAPECKKAKTELSSPEGEKHHPLSTTSPDNFDKTATSSASPRQPETPSRVNPLNYHKERRTPPPNPQTPLKDGNETSSKTEVKGAPEEPLEDREAEEPSRGPRGQGAVTRAEAAKAPKEVPKEAHTTRKPEGPTIHLLEKGIVTGAEPLTLLEEKPKKAYTNTKPERPSAPLLERDAATIENEATPVKRGNQQEIKAATGQVRPQRLKLSGPKRSPILESITLAVPAIPSQSTGETAKTKNGRKAKSMTPSEDKATDKAMKTAQGAILVNDEPSTVSAGPRVLKYPDVREINSYTEDFDPSKDANHLSASRATPKTLDDDSDEDLPVL